METNYWTTGVRQIKFGLGKYQKLNNTSLVKHFSYITKYKHKDEATQ